MSPNPTSEPVHLDLALLTRAMAPMFASLPSLISSAVIAICSLLNVLTHFGLHLYVYARPDGQAVNMEPFFSSAITQVALGGVAAGWAFKTGRRERRAVKARARAGVGPGPA